MFKTNGYPIAPMVNVPLDAIEALDRRAGRGDAIVEVFINLRRPRHRRVNVWVQGARGAGYGHSGYGHPEARRGVGV